MAVEIWLLVILVIASLVILKKSFDWGMLPWALMLVVGLFGFLFFGIFGLIGGLVGGYILNFILSFVFGISSKVFDIGLLRKKDRELIAKGFLSEYRAEITALKKQQDWTVEVMKGVGFISDKQKISGKQEIEKTFTDEQVIDVFSRYINKIYEEANKLENPVKRHPHDLEVAGLRENFIRGGENWVNSFKNSTEREVMKKFVEFCENVIYDNPERVGGIKANR